jgi:hypothetical protein
LPDQIFVWALTGGEEREQEEGLMSWEKGERMANYHDSPMAGHPRVKHTMDLLCHVGENWLGIWKDIQEYVTGCITCQKVKPNARRLSNLLNLLPILEEPWEAISWDLISPLLESWGYNAIITIVDLRMKGIKLEASSMALSTMGTVHIMRDRVYQEEGVQ